MRKWSSYKEWELERRLFIKDLKNKPCLDCGNSYPPECMDFDHRDPKDKDGEINKLIKSYSLERILREIEKCDLICSNCHRIRTRKQIDLKYGFEIEYSEKRQQYLNTITSNRLDRLDRKRIEISTRLEKQADRLKTLVNKKTQQIAEKERREAINLQLEIKRAEENVLKTRQELKIQLEKKKKETEKENERIEIQNLIIEAKHCEMLVEREKERLRVIQLIKENPEPKPKYILGQTYVAGVGWVNKEPAIKSL